MSGMAISTTSLSKHFRKLEALKNISLDVPTGSVYALVGPNGAGKTTLIKVLMNIIEGSRGRAEVLGLPSTQIRGRALEIIGYVSENQELPLWMTVRSFLDYLRFFYPTWDADLEKELIRQFQLPVDRKLRHLSRGMRMKAALAGALAFHPKLIVLDEPFTGLDPLVRDELIQSLLERAEEATILISSHDLAEIESFATHVGFLESGRLRFSEELASLTDRFREVELTFDLPPALPANAPGTWKQINQAATVIRFVDSHFDAERSSAEIQKTFGTVKNVSFNPMSLRSIFLAMARDSRNSECEEVQG